MSHEVNKKIAPKKGKGDNKNDAKEQRKPRQRPDNAQTVKKIDKKNYEDAAKAPSKPEYQEPGPEFYKNLKRETDEILKITEESKAKYNKKVIESNWKKYEMPIASYDDIEEQENMGEDYEKLIQAPLSTGSHFQFKHEKSWNSVTAPSQYDKYFKIDPDSLAVALSSIPFYERNHLDTKLFTPFDITNMENRAAKYKERYENDKLYKSTKTVQSFTDVVNEDQDNESDGVEFLTFPKTINNKLEPVLPRTGNLSESSIVDDKDDQFTIDDGSNERENIIQILDENEIKRENEIPIPEIPIEPANKCTDTVPDVKPVNTNANTVIESPDDLEKWLDDFLDG